MKFVLQNKNLSFVVGFLLNVLNVVIKNAN